MKHHSTSVFVDDYIAGRTPGVCIVTGEPTSDRLVLRTEIDGPSPAWFVLILFPILGWLVLAVVMAASRRSYLTGSVPLSADAYRDVRRRRRAALATAVGGLVLLLLAATALIDVIDAAAVGIALMMILGGLVAYLVIETRSPRVRLDGSRRWVTISRVHPAFDAAVKAGAATTADRS